MLSCHDDDSNSDDAVLLYDIAIPVGHGTLLRNGTAISTFSQKDIVDQLVYYDLTSGKLSQIGVSLRGILCHVASTDG